MKTTRQRILDYLNIKQAASAQEMGRALHLTAADVRHHLSVLVTEGVVHPLGERRPAGRGRPSKLFGLVRLFSEHNLDRLADALIDQWAGSPVFTETASQPEGAGNALLFHELARRLAPDLPQSRNPGKNLVQAVEQLNQQHYHARWEAHAQGPRVIFGHCPYAAILHKHPDICHMDTALLERLLGQPVHQTARREPNPQGLPQCVFIIHK